MAKLARGRSRTATAKAPAPKTAQAVEPPAARKPAPAEKPAVALVPDAPAEKPRPGLPPATEVKRGRKPKAKASRNPILVLVETVEESGQFASEQVSTVVELLDLLDEKRKVLVTRNWREF